MQAAPVQFDTFALKGGLDLHTPQLSLPPGTARTAVNWEVSINGGYSRIPGYERFDGRTSPTGVSFTVLALSSVAGLAVGDTINNLGSTVTGVVCYISGTNVGYTKAVGTFTAATTLYKGATPIGTINTVGVSLTSQVELATAQLGAANIYRADITAVPGSGPVRGVCVFNGSVYAARDNAGATAIGFYRATSSGWTALTLPYEVAFNTGNGTQPAEGATITKGAVSAVVRRVVTESGTWSGGTAAGRFIVDAPTGGTFTAGALTAGATANLTAGLSGGLVQAQVSFLPGGTFEFYQGNAGNGVRMYGCDRVNRGFEFDGTYIVPIRTGMATDTPTHVVVHKRHLFFSFGPSAQHAGVGTPYVWSPVTGAGEIGVNQNIEGFLVLPGDTQSASLALLSNDTTSILYGTGVSSWNLIELNAKVGAKPRSQKTLNQSFIFDDNGIVTIEGVQEFGNFGTTAITVNLRQFVQSRRTLVTDSLINYEKSQYRVFFSDGYGLYCTVVNGRYRGAMPVLFPNPVACCASGESTNGGEVSYFGSTNGYVYRLDIGTSFDGAAIDHSFDLAFASQGNARIRKRYRKAVLEMQGDSYAEFSMGYTLAYGDQDVVPSTASAPVLPVYWDEFTWDEFVWDGRNIAPSQLSISGSAENISLRIEGSSALWGSFTINSITLHYSPRRILR